MADGGAVAPKHSAQAVLAYQRDLFERGILFWDALRRRADNMIAHEHAGKPPLLDFDYEMLLDARRFEHPANYALLRITRIGDACFDDCVDAANPDFSHKKVHRGAESAKVVL